MKGKWDGASEGASMQADNGANDGANSGANSGANDGQRTFRPATTPPPDRSRWSSMRLSPLWLALLLVACSDPGSGGTGIPGPSAGAPPPPAPVEAPPPNADAPAAVPPDCATTPGAGTEPYVGQVRALADGCLLVNERAIVITMAAIERRSGTAATAADLVVGIQVTVVPEPTDAGRARTVIIEDTGI